jgi:hypothetical protein
MDGMSDAPHALRRDDGTVEKPSWDPCSSASMQETLVMPPNMG